MTGTCPSYLRPLLCLAAIAAVLALLHAGVPHGVAAVPAPAAPPVSDTPVLTMRVVSGAGQYGHRDSILSEPVVVSVTDSAGTPVPGIALSFVVLEGASGPVERDIRTHADGTARFFWRLGNSEGEQLLLVRAPGTLIEPVTVAAVANHPYWLLFLAFGMLGGLGVFLYGMEFMGAGLQKWAGARLRAILAALTRNRVIGLFVGLFVTAVIQSSSATTVMLVGFTNAGLMSLAQAIGVILGADIGTTVTAQIVAFKLTDYALAFVGVGFLIYLFGGKNQNLKYGGQVLLGFGFLFFGLKIMSDVLHPLRAYPPFIDLLKNAENPYVGLLVATLFTSIVQSSSATTSLVVMLAAQGFFDLRSAIPLIFGANIGTCVTAAIATIGTTREAKRVAVAHYTFKFAGVLLFWFLVEPLALATEWLSVQFAGATATTVRDVAFLPRQVANAHTIFNVAMALIFLPWTHLFEKLIYRLLPEQLRPEAAFRPKHLDPALLATPELAIAAAEQEVARSGDIARTMTANVLQGFRRRDLAFVQEVIAEDDKIDILDTAGRSYLARLAGENLIPEQAQRCSELFIISNEWEHIGDVISKDMMPLVQRLIDSNLYFSEEGWMELREYHAAVEQVVADAVTAFRTRDTGLATDLRNRKPVLVRREKELRRAHLRRLHGGNEREVATSEIYLDLMTGYARILSYATSAAYATLGEV